MKIFLGGVSVHPVLVATDMTQNCLLGTDIQWTAVTERSFKVEQQPSLVKARSRSKLETDTALEMELGCPTSTTKSTGY